jgi:hypothetical protein
VADQKNMRKPEQRGSGRFEAGGELGAVEDLSEREQRLNSLSGEERQLAEESARCADLCHYFSRKNMDVPGHVADELGRISRLSIAERITRMKALNQALMEYLNDAGHDTGIRQ